MNKIVLFGIIAIIFLALAGGLTNLHLGNIIGSGNYIERPVFKYVKCEAISDFKYTTPYDISSAGQWLNKPSVSSSYNIKFIKPASTNFDAKCLIPLANCKATINYYVCNSQILDSSNCRIWNNYLDSSEITNIKNNEVVWAQYQIISTYGKTAVSGLTYQVGYVPYGLREYDVLSGSPSTSPINPNDCSIPSSYTSGRATVTSDNIAKTDIVSPKTNQNTLQPEEIRWYVSGYLTSSAPSFMMTYQGQSAWCRTVGTQGEVYKINSITTDQGTFSVASPDWSDHLGTIACCPKSVLGDQVCKDDGSGYQQIAGTQCGSFKSCGSANPVPYSAKQTIQYSCVNGYCKSQINNVECASDSDCQDANKVCNNFKCVQANVDLSGQIIKTIPDNKGDCENQGGTWISSTTTTKEGALCFWGVGLCKDKIVTNDYCDLNKIDWIKWIVIIAIIIVIALLWKQILMVVRRVFHIG